MFRVAGAYEYREAFERVSDVADRMRREPDLYPAPVDDDDDQSTGWRGLPVTAWDMACFALAGGKVTICPTPVQKVPALPWTEIQTGLKHDFRPASYAVDTCIDHLKSIKARSRRDLHVVERARAIIKGVLQGLPFNVAAKELSLDPGFVSKTLRKVYKKYPKLKSAFVNT